MFFKRKSNAIQIALKTIREKDINNLKRKVRILMVDDGEYPVIEL